jgi:hypothetical protein
MPVNIDCDSLMTDATKSVTLDRELEEEKGPDTSGPPRIRFPLCG